MNTVARLIVCLTLFLILGVSVNAVMAGEAAMDSDLKSKAKRATDYGMNYLRTEQEENGSWANSVGVTAIAARAFLESRRGYTEADLPFLAKAIQFIVSNAREDGAISESLQNTNYNTATALFALKATGNPAYAAIIDNAGNFIGKLQSDEGEGYSRSHKYYGGIGYGGDERPDMSNMLYAVEALRAAAGDPNDPIWSKALVFVTRSQNWSETNDLEWAANDGGFTYMPGWSPHGGSGSYGSMTHAGLISLIYAGVDKSDPRIGAAWNWIRANYTLDDNPGAKKKQGLFYYYTAFAKSMFAYGEDVVTDTDGVEHNWRNDLATKILSLQAKDGSWVNEESARWWEGLKVLTTARSVVALNLVVR